MVLTQVSLFTIASCLNEFGQTLDLQALIHKVGVSITFVVDGREDNYVYVSEALMAGVAAGSMESLISSPFELIKLRAQVASVSRFPRLISTAESKAVSPLIDKLLCGYSPDKVALNNSVALLSTLSAKHPNLVGALREYPWMMTGSGKAPSVCDVQKPSNIISLEGWGALWRGLRPGVVRDSVYGGIFFSTWQFLHRAMLDWKAVGMDPIPRFGNVLLINMCKNLLLLFASHRLMEGAFLLYSLILFLSYI